MKKKTFEVELSIPTARIVTRPDLEDLKDFDKDRILSRPYFEHLKLSAGSDKEILNNLSSNDISEIENSIKRLREILVSVESYSVCLSDKFKENQIRLEAVEYLMKSTDEDLLQELSQNLKSEEKNISDMKMATLKLIQDIKVIIEFYNKKVVEHYRKTFAGRLKQARLAAGFTQSQLANAVNMSQNGFQLYEAARQEPSLTTLIRLSKILKQPTDWLLGFSETGT